MGGKGLLGWVGAVLLLGVLALSANGWAVNLEWDPSNTSGDAWNTTSPRFKNGSNYVPYENGANVTFGASNAQAIRIINNATETPVDVSSMTVTGDYTFSGGEIRSYMPSSSVKLEITGGNVTFNNDVKFNEGLSDNNTLVIRGGGHTKFTKAAEFGGTGSITGNSRVTFSGTLAVNGPFTIEGGSTVQLDTSSTASSDTIFTGGGILEKIGGGVYTLTSSSAGLTGVVNITAGALALVNDASFAQATVVLAGSTQLQLGALNEDAVVKTLSGSGDVSIYGDRNLMLTSTNNFTGAINKAAGTGTGGLVVNGTANDTVTLHSNNSYEGHTTINNATLELKNGGSIASSSGVTMNGGRFTIAAANGDRSLKDLSGNGQVELGNNTLEIDRSSTAGAYDNKSFDGRITGNGGFTLDLNDASHEYTLNNDNTYGGATTIDTGKLILGEKGKIANSSKVDVNGTNGGSLALAGVAANAADIDKKVVVKKLSGGGDVDIGENRILSLKAVESFSGELTGLGGLDINGATPGTIIELNEDNFDVATSYSGATTVSGGQFKLSGTGDLSASSGLDLLGQNTKFIDGTNSGVTVKELKGSASSTVELGANDITIGTGDAPRQAHFLGKYEGNITSNASTGGGLIINGNSADDVFTLTNENTYGGSTTVTRGTLELGVDATIDNSKQIDVATANSRVVLAAADENAPSTVKFNALIGAGTVDVGANRALSIASTRAASGGAHQFKGQITGTGGVTVDGDLQFSTAQTYKGLTTLNSGSLTLATVGQGTGSIADSDGVDLKGGTTLTLANNTNASIKQINGTAINNSTIDIRANTLTVTNGGEYAGYITGTGNLNVHGTNAQHSDLFLTGDNSGKFSGDISIVEGSLTLAESARLNQAVDITLGADGVFDISTLSANERHVTLHSLTTTDGANPNTKVLMGTDSTQNLTVTTDSTFAGNISGAGNLVFDSTLGNQTMTLKAKNEYTGTTTVSDGDTLRLTDDGTIENSAGVILSAGSSFEIDRADTTKIKTLNSSSADSTVGIAAGSTLHITGSNASTNLGSFAGEINGDALGEGNLVIGSATNNQRSEFTFTGTADYTGTTTITNATFKLGANTNINESKEIIVGQNGTLDLTAAHNSAQYIMHNKLSSAEGTDNSATILLGSNSLYIDHGQSSSYGGSISGTGNNYLGIGDMSATTVTLTGRITDIGTTVISTNSTLKLANTTSLDSNNVQIGSGSTLEMNGATINGEVTTGGTLKAAGKINGNVTVSNGGSFTSINNLSDTANPNGITISGNFTAANGSTSTLALGRNGNGVSVGGNVALNGDLVLAGSDGISDVGSGVYHLFSSGANNITDVASIAHTIIGGASAILIRDGNVLKIAVQEAGKLTQVWNGNGTHGVWNTANTNWNDIFGDEIIADKWQGSVASFTNDATKARDIEVSGNGANQVKFDTIDFGGDGYRIHGDSLQFAPASGSTTATIQVQGGQKATIESVLAGNDANQNLQVDGAGTLILSGNNTYTGGTTIKGGATVQMDHVNALGTGTGATDAINIQDGNLALNFGTSVTAETLDKRITGTGNATLNNSVTVMENANVILGHAQNDYSVKTIIDEGAKLSTTTAGKLSANSVHELRSGAILDISNGSQEIAGLTSILNPTLTPTVALGSNTLTIDNNNGESEIYHGALTGLNTSKLVKEGSGTQVFTSFDSAAFGGTITNTAGTLALIGKSGADMNLRLAGGAGGTIQVDVDNRNRNIFISNTGGTSFAGALEAYNGIVVLGATDATELDALADTHLKLMNSDVGMRVTGNATNGANTVKELTLSGDNHIYLEKNAADKLSYLNVTGNVNASGLTTLHIDTSAIGGIESKNFFQLLGDSGKTLLIDSVNDLSLSNFTVVDGNNNPLIGSGQMYEINQGGVHTGWAFITGELGTTGGLYFQQTLTGIQSDNNVEINSNGTPSGILPLNTRAVGPNVGDETMTAVLSGNGGFTFKGDKNIFVSGNNTYAGMTTINMDSSISVFMQNSNAFGRPGAVEILGGTLNINDVKNVAFTTLDGNAGTGLNLGDGTGGGGSLSLTNAATDSNTFAGKVSGTGSITKNGPGTQLFTDTNNDYNGSLTVNGGKMAWAGGTAARHASSVSVNYGGEFTQLGSHVGPVTVNGQGSKVSGHGTIYGDLNITGGASYVISADSGSFDMTTVNGKTFFGQGSTVAFNNDALALLYMNPNRTVDFITSTGGITTSWLNNSIPVNMGLLGIANIRVSDNGRTLSNEGLDAPIGTPSQTITGLWAGNGINISDITKQSNVADAVSSTFNRFIGSNLASNPSLNARFANAKFMGIGAVAGNVRYSGETVLSVFNHESGLNATQPVDAMLDTGRAMLGQGVMNRVNSLRAARTIYAAAPQTAGAPAAARSDDAYGSLVVGEGYILADGSYQPVYQPDYYPVYSAARQTAPLASGPDYSANRVWASGIGNWNKYDTSSGGIAGYSYDAGGFMLGMDRSVNDFTFGGAFAYTHGTLEDKLALASSTKLDSWSANLYADYNHESGVNVMGFGGFQWFTTDVSRTVAGFRDEGGILVADYGNESADYDGMGWYAGANASYDFLPMDRLTVTPSIGLTYSDVRSKSFDRTTVRSGGAVLVDSFGQVRRHSIAMPIDIAAAYDVIVERDRKLSILGNAGYAYEFNNKGAKGSYRWADGVASPSVSFTGRDPGRSTWNFGIGARYQKQNIDFDVKYDYLHRTDLRNHRLSASVGLEF